MAASHQMRICVWISMRTCTRRWILQGNKGSKAMKTHKTYSSSKKHKEEIQGMTMGMIIIHRNTGVGWDDDNIPGRGMMIIYPSLETYCANVKGVQGICEHNTYAVPLLCGQPARPRHCCCSWGKPLCRGFCRQDVGWLENEGASREPSGPRHKGAWQQAQGQRHVGLARPIVV